MKQQRSAPDRRIYKALPEGLKLSAALQAKQVTVLKHEFITPWRQYAGC